MLNPLPSLQVTARPRRKKRRRKKRKGRKRRLRKRKTGGEKKKKKHSSEAPESSNDDSPRCEAAEASEGVTAAPVAADDQPDSSAPEPKVDTRKPAEPAGEPPARREAEDREAERRRDAAELLEYQRKEAARSRTTRGPRKSQKQGDLRKCPTCWRQVGGGDT